MTEEPHGPSSDAPHEVSEAPEVLPPAEGHSRPPLSRWPRLPSWRWLLGGLRGFGVVLAVLVSFVAGLWLSPGGDDAARHDHGAQKAPDTRVWTCSMHPQIRLPEPGQCPICGMDLIPLQEGAESGRTDRRVTLSEDAAKLAEVRTTLVYHGAATDELRLLGRLEYDETAVRTITSWVGGRIERLYVSAVGARVGAGQAIAQIYSPEVYAAHQDLILAKKQVSQLKDALPVARSAAEASFKAARQRLTLLGIREAALAEMEQADAPTQHIQIHAPFGGTVLEQMVNQGAYVATGTPLFRVAALGRIWVQLDAYETDLPRIRLKDVVTIQVASFPGKRFEGKVTFIDPVLDPQSRTAQVRIEVSNKEGKLRPGMFAEAVIHVPEGEHPEAPLVVPEGAVLFTGERSVVFVRVEAEKPTYEAREVQLGPRAGHVYPVVSGLEAGERVVSHGAFSLDAELQIQGGKSMMTMPDDLEREHGRPFSVPKKELANLTPVLRVALSLQQALSKDDFGAAKAAFGELKSAAESAKVRAPTDAAKRWDEIQEELIRYAGQGAQAKTIDEARKQFEKLSQRLIEVTRRYGNPIDAKVRLAFCPMAFDGKGAEWLQEEEGVQNPFLGSKMYGCGDIRASASSGELLPPAKTDEGHVPAPAGHQH